LGETCWYRWRRLRQGWWRGRWRRRGWWRSRWVPRRWWQWRREGHVVRCHVRGAAPRILADSTRHTAGVCTRVEVALAIKVAVPSGHWVVYAAVRSPAAAASRARTACRVTHPARAKRRCGQCHGRRGGRGRGWRRRGRGWGRRGRGRRRRRWRRWRWTRWRLRWRWQGRWWWSAR
jgi:hypothetical protein